MAIITVYIQKRPNDLEEELCFGLVEMKLIMGIDWKTTYRLLNLSQRMKDGD